MQLDGCTLLDIYGVERTTLSGHVSPRQLGDLFVDNWIPYMECHKCGRSDYCRFAKPHPHNEHKKLEIRCGVAETAIRNFVDHTFEMARDLALPQRQAYLDGSFHLLRFILEAEQTIGNAICTDFLNWLGKYSPTHFGRITRLRDSLNSLGQSFRQIPELYSQRSLLLVEGWAEKAFLDKLRESHSTWFLDLLVECYDGKGNRKSKRIAMLLDKYLELGYTIYAQGDADGKPGEIFKGLVDSGQLQMPNTFTFPIDFETAIPVPLLFRGLRRVGANVNFTPTQLRDAAKDSGLSINVILERQFGVDTEPLKVELATAVAELLNISRHAWWQDDAFMDTELGRFLRFIQMMA
jgi:hypothetical protein